MALPAGSSTMAKLRTILVKVSPAPATLSERRAILRVLKQRGEVECFKKLHDSSHFISVVESPQMALGLVERSPLQFDYVPQPSRKGPDNSANAVSAKKTFLVKIVEKSAYQHKTRIRESLVHGRWPQHDNLFLQDSFPKAALRQVCPQDMAWNGLVDWETGGQIDEDDGLSTWLSSKGDYAQSRRIRQRNKTTFDSLLEAYNAKHGNKEGRQEGGEGEGQADANTRPAAGSRSGAV